ncbi:type II toxin-antitoxin system Phd/YefM family antitoxin [Ottowia beijingensis]|uniref:type II toxin-antitoxin system Phd/YefM family antitoxin n=1 Tax=Ottowia beijingensis TaxID=1207057 RepID=UPI0036296703
MRNVTVVEAKSRFSALLAEVDEGAEIDITRHGKVVARLVPARPRMASEAFADFWSDTDGFDLQAPPDLPPEDPPALDA